MIRVGNNATCFVVVALFWGPQRGLLWSVGQPVLMIIIEVVKMMGLIC
jgi:hypothetical protein